MANANLDERRLTAPELAELTINDLVAAYPEVMGVLAPLGIDLCCGGVHQLGHALDLHGLDRATILPRVAGAIAASIARDGSA